MRKYASRSGKILNSNERGVILIWLIFILVAAGIVGSSMVYLTTSSTYDELFVNNQARAYYIAEAGGRYVIPLMLQNPVAAEADINDNTFTLINGDEFKISEMDINSVPMTVVSEGIVNKDSWLEGRRKITYGMVKTFYDDPFDDQADFDNLWDIVGDDNASILNDVTKTDGDPALRFKDMNTDYKINIGLDWEDKSEFPQLDEIRAITTDPDPPHDPLLSYEVQVKVKLNQTSVAHGNYYGMGLSFRLDLKGTVGDPSDDTSYGISIFKSHKDNHPSHQPVAGMEWYDDFYSITNPNHLDDGKIYLVIWKQVPGDDPEYTILDKAELDASYVVISDEELNINPWSTIVVTVTEKIVGGNRTNEIEGFIQGPGDPLDSETDYPRGTISWDFPPVSPDDGAFVSVIFIDEDDSFTSDQGFDSPPYPEEFGIHAFYDQQNNNDIFFDDFAFRIVAPGRALDKPIQY